MRIFLTDEFPVHGSQGQEGLRERVDPGGPEAAFIEIRYVIDELLITYACCSAGLAPDGGDPRSRENNYDVEVECLTRSVRKDLVSYSHGPPEKPFDRGIVRRIAV